MRRTRKPAVLFVHVLAADHKGGAVGAISRAANGLSSPWSSVGATGSSVSHLPGSLPRPPSVETHPGRTLSDPSAARAISTMPTTETPRVEEITYAGTPFLARRRGSSPPTRPHPRRRGSCVDSNIGPSASDCEYDQQAGLVHRETVVCAHRHRVDLVSAITFGSSRTYSSRPLGPRTSSEDACTLVVLAPPARADEHEARVERDPSGRVAVEHEHTALGGEVESSRVCRSARFGHGRGAGELREGHAAVRCGFYTCQVGTIARALV